MSTFYQYISIKEDHGDENMNRIPEQDKLIMTDDMDIHATTEGYDKELGAIILFAAIFGYIYWRLTSW